MSRAPRSWALIVGLILAAVFVGLPERARAVEVDRIDVTGVTLFGRTEIELAMELSVGEKLERAKVVKTAENLVSLYRQKGYEQAQVKGDLIRDKDERGRIESILRFTISEGGPTRVAAFRVVSTGQALDASLLSRVELQAGEVFDQEHVATVRRQITEALISDEFVGARIEEVRVTDSVAPASSAARGLLAARWVSVELRVEPGDRATFGFRGNEFFTRAELLGFINDQRVIGLSKDYVAAIQKRIEDEYRARGFTQVRIRSFVFEPGRRPRAKERHITYEVVEGPRVEIESLEFDGNSAFPASMLRKEFYQRGPVLVQRRYYVEKQVQATAELLIEWMQSQGYLASKLVAVNRTFIEDGAKVRLVIYLYEGDQTTVQSLRISGVRSLREDEVTALLGVREGQPLNLFAFNEGLELLKNTYRAKGFLDARITNEDSDKVVRYSQDNRAAEISIDVAEGPQYHVGKISIEGLGRTRQEVVHRELGLVEGEVLDQSKILAAEARLRRLGIFGEANLRILEQGRDSASRDIRVVVQEGSPGLVAGGAGFRQDLGVRGFAQTGYTNLFGRNHEINLNLNLNYRELGGVFCDDLRGRCFIEGQAQVGYVWPWFFGDRTTFRPRLQAERTRYVKFDVQSFSAAAIWERPLIRSLGLVGVMTYNLERTQQYNSLNDDGTKDRDRTMTIGAIIPSLRLDLRDNALAPTRGFFGYTSFELSDPALGSQSNPPVAYYRFQLRADQQVPVSRDISLYLSFRTGYARNNVRPPEGLTNDQLDDYALPKVKQFALGGVTSLRGFQEQQFNFQKFNVLGVISYVNYRSQLDLPFAGALRFGVFLDAGNLLIDRPNQPVYSLTHDMKFGSGFGFHYQSPVGPVNFDVGFALGPIPADQSRQRFYFSIGVL